MIELYTKNYDIISSVLLDIANDVSKIYFLNLMLKND